MICLSNTSLVLALLLIWCIITDSFHLEGPRTRRLLHPSIPTVVTSWRSNHQHEHRSRLPDITVIPSQSNRHNFAVTSGGSLDLVDDKNSTTSMPDWKVFVPIVAIAGLGIAATNGGFDVTPFLEQAVDQIHSLGPLGYAYFAGIYILAEVLAVPAFPLTASSGYLFGLIPGFLTVLVSATIAASISFLIGRTLLRDWAQKIAVTSPKWRAIDKAVSREGFKVILLLRMSPLLPFAISNYLYGLTSVDFWSYLAGTFLGFAPGTLGIVYAGSAGKAIFDSDSISSLPWYAYAAGGAVVLLFANTITKVATDALKAMEEEEAEEIAAKARLYDDDENN